VKPCSPMTPVMRISSKAGASLCYTVVRTRGTCDDAIYYVSEGGHFLQLRFCTGWGDTGTALVLSEALDIDVYLYMTPDPRIAARDLPNKFKPLLFRKASHSATKGARQLTIRYHDGHFIYLTRFGECAARFGAVASWEHHFKGSHDVATGMCVIFSFTPLWSVYNTSTSCIYPGTGLY
jgi:hypothetical protein